MKQSLAFRPCFALLGRNWWWSKRSKLPDSQVDSLPFPIEEQRLHSEPIGYESNCDVTTAMLRECPAVLARATNTGRECPEAGARAAAAGR